MADDSELLRGFLRDRDELCPSCRYNLRDLVARHCPECGEPLRLGVSSARSIDPAFIAGCIALAFPVGVSANGVIATAYLLLMDQLSFSDVLWPGFIVNGVVLLISLAGLVAWLRFVQWICGLSRSRRWLLAGVCWFLMLCGYSLCLILFF